MTLWKRLVDGGPRESADALSRALESLISGIAAHSISFDTTDQLQFKAEINEQLRKLSGHASAQPVVDAVNKATESYHDLTLHRIQMRLSQLRGVVSIFSKHVIDSSACGREHIDQLAQAEKQLESATELCHFMQIKSSLTESLKKIRETQLAQQDRASRILCETAPEIAPAPGTTPEPRTPPDPPDPRTGFPSRKGAEARLVYNRAHGLPNFLTVFVLQNYDAVCNRHGMDAGDQLYAHLAHVVADQMPGETKFFSWSGSSFVALLTNPRQIDAATREIAKITAARMELTMTTGDRQTHLPVNVAATSILDEPTNPFPDWQSKVDVFVASHR